MPQPLQVALVLLHQLSVNQQSYISSLHYNSYQYK
ncbi:hypothetical protein [Candidatus Schmidhempelia bombi]